jgi:septation ring formation regulator EzrA
MAGLSGEISAGSIMNKTAQRIFEKKSERRRELAALPFAKKIEIVEQLRDLGRATKKFRTQTRVGR